MSKIPKIIHYCWLNGNEFPELIQKCQKSWKEKLPDYEFKLWTAENFDINMYDYTREAFAEGKYAFVSDVIRLYALYTEGGIYLDTDMEVLRTFDELLENKAFAGFQNEYSIATCIFGSEKGNPLFKEFLDYYEGRHFIKPSGKYDMTPNPVPITDTCKKRGLILNNQVQELDQITIYTQDYFCPYNHVTQELKITDNSYAIHYFDASWIPDTQKKMVAKRRVLEKKYGRAIGLLYQGIIDIRFNGLKSCFSKMRRSLKK